MTKVIEPPTNATKFTDNITVTIAPPNFKTAVFLVCGTAPYVENKFSQKARDQMAAMMEAGSQGKKGKKREAKNFDEQYRGAMHISEDGWHGQPASAYRQAMISACRTVGYKMTHAKLGFIVLADGIDAQDGTPLVRIIEGEPEKHRAYVRLANGAPDIIDRPMWRQWKVYLQVKFDADMFSLADIANLLARAGQQVGIGAGRPDSKMSSGCGWGTFEIEQEEVK